MKIKYAVGLLIVITLCLFAMELMLRLCGHVPEYHRGGPANSDVEDWIVDPLLGWRNGPNDFVIHDSILPPSTVRTDSEGYRNSCNPSPSSDAPLVVFIGDSITFSAEVDDCYTGPALTGSLIRRELPGIQIINAGVRGYSTLQSERMLEEVLARHPNVALVCYTFVWNDFVENIFPDMHLLLAPVATLDGSVELTVREVNPEEENAILAKAEKKREAHLKAQEKYFREESALKKFAKRHSVLASDILRARYRLAERFTAHARESEDAVQAQLRQAKDQHGVEILTRLLSKMQRACAAHGCRLLTAQYTQYNGYDTRYYDFAQICRNLGIDYVDISKGFTGARTSYLTKKTDGTYDAHYGYKGNLVFAHAVAPMAISMLKR